MKIGYKIKRKETFKDITENKIYSSFSIDIKGSNFKSKRYVYVEIKNNDYDIITDFYLSKYDITNWTKNDDGEYITYMDFFKTKNQKRELKTIKSPFNIMVKDLENKLNQINDNWLFDILFTNRPYTNNIIGFIDTDFFYFYVDNENIIYNFTKQNNDETFKQTLLNEKPLLKRMYQIEKIKEKIKQKNN